MRYAQDAERVVACSVAHSSGVLKMLLGTFLTKRGKIFGLPMLTETSRAAVILLTSPSFRHSRRVER